MDDLSLTLILCIPIICVSYLLFSAYLYFTEYLSEKISKNKDLKLLAITFSIIAYIFLVCICLFNQSDIKALFKYTSIIGALIVFDLTITYFCHKELNETSDITDTNDKEISKNFSYYLLGFVYVINYLLYIISIAFYLQSKHFESYILLTTAFLFTAIILTAKLSLTKLTNGNLNESAFIIGFVLLCITIIGTISFSIYQYAEYKNLSADYTKLQEEYDSLSAKYDDVIDEYSEIQRNMVEARMELEKYQKYAVFVNEGSNYYHTYKCPLQKGSFWIYNVEAAEGRGYQPCPICRN